MADCGIRWVMRWNVERGDVGIAPGMPLATTLRLLSLDTRDAALRARLHAQSPIANVAKLRRPVLLLAGGDDAVVPIRAVVHYAAALRTAGKPVSLLVEPDGAHSPTDPVPREAYVYLLEAMLHRHLGGPAPAPPDTALHAYLRRNMRLDGVGLLASPPRKSAMHVP